MPDTPILSRAAPAPAIVEGRTLEGIAYRYDHPSKVTDGGDPYFEEFLVGCDTKTIRDRGVFPLGMWHPWSSNAGLMPAQPVGSVRFEPSDAEHALMFSATVSRTRLGDEALELVRDRASEDVSVSYRPVRERPRRASNGAIIIGRAEIAIRELSLAPTGLGQHDDAKVLVMRAHPAQQRPLDRLEQSRRRRLLL
jgi:hypothetical protein